jgi:hypothetical protein
MPSDYKRDDDKRLITVTMTEPFSMADFIGVVERQAAEDTWSYALLYDLRSLETIKEASPMLQTFVDRLQVLGAGRTRGPIGVVVGRGSDKIRASVVKTRTEARLNFEILVTDLQVDEWLARNTRGGGSPRGS